MMMQIKFLNLHSYKAYFIRRSHVKFRRRQMQQFNQYR